MAVKESISDRVFNAINIFLLALLLLIVAYPLYFVVIASFSDATLVGSGKVIFAPKGITFAGYEMVLAYSDVWIGYRNTIFYALAATLINLAVTLPAAYALARRDFRWRRFFTTVFMVPMFFGGGLIPFYLLITQTLHWNDTIWVMIVPGATGFMQMMIARTFFQTTIPEELRESAEIDGASNFLIFFRIVLPLSTAIIAVQALQCAVGNWNAYFNAMMYLSDREGRNLKSLQVVLRNILVLSQSQAAISEKMADQTNYAEFQQKAEQLKYALIIVSCIPILLVYPFVQKYFVKGIMVGSIKG
jgi:putative aldouronate transport system permease protein